MNFFITLLAIVIVIVYITDITDFPITFKKIISYWLTNGNQIKTDFTFHLIDCSACQSFHVGMIWFIIYSCIWGFNIINLPIVALVACGTVTIKNLILLFFDILDTIIAKINRLL